MRDEFQDSLGGVYAGNALAGVYDLPDDDILPDENLVGESEQAEEGPPKSFLDSIDRIKSIIDNNFDYIWNFLESLKTNNPSLYQGYKAEYDKLASDYQQMIGDAYQAQQSDDKNIQSSILESLRKLLDFTNEITTNINNQSADMEFPDESIADEGMPGTSMVMHDDVIEMENVGAARAFWDGMSPGMKTLIKAAAIGGVIFGGKIVYDKYVKK